MTTTPQPTSADLLLNGHPDVSELSDDQLADVLARADALMVRVRAEQAERRQEARYRRRSNRLGEGRTSCVFCRRVYLVGLVATHLMQEHRDDVATLRPRRHKVA